jgi:allantoin racemase
VKLLLINPNLTQAVTDAVAAAARPGTEIVAVTGGFGPQVIGSRAENARAAHGVLELVAQHGDAVDAVVLAVSLDTTLWACRGQLDKPVVGMTEAALLTGVMVGTRLGVLTYGVRLGPVYRELVESYGLGARLAVVETVDVTPQQTFTEPERVLAAVQDGVMKLVAQGTEVVVLAGAAMAQMAPRLQGAVPEPLLDGVACTVTLAETLVQLKLPRPCIGSLTPTGGLAVYGVSPTLQQLFARGG